MKRKFELRKLDRSHSIRDLNDQLAKDPTKVCSWLRLGEVHMEQNNFQEAAICIETASTLGNFKNMNGKLRAVNKAIQKNNYAKVQNRLFSIKELCWNDFRKH